MKMVFVNGQVWDGESDRAVPADVLIDGSRIEAVAGTPGIIAARRRERH